MDTSNGNLDDAEAPYIQRAVTASNLALKGNFTGPLVTAVAFVSLDFEMHNELRLMHFIL